MVEFRNVANFDAVWLPRWRRGEVRAYRAKKSKKKVCSDYLFENSCKLLLYDLATSTRWNVLYPLIIFYHPSLEGFYWLEVTA